MADSPYHHGDLPAALLRAVGELIVEGGPGAVSVRAVARRAGVSHAAPAHHFGDRAGLLSAYASQGFEAFLAALREAMGELPEDSSVTDAVLAMGAAYVDFGLAQASRYAVMFRPEMVDEEDEGLSEAGRRAFAALLAVLRAGLAEDATDEDVLVLAMATWSTVHGLVSLSLDTPKDAPRPPLDRLVAGTLGVLVAGLRSHPLWVGDGTSRTAIDADLEDPILAQA